MTDELVRERRGPVLIVRLNRPEARNALNGALLSGIGNAITEAEADPEIRAVVLTGTGDRAFCAGMDLKAFAGGENIGADAEGYNRLMRGELTIPVVGAANGSAIGGGLEMLLNCDVIVASAAAKFGFPEVKRGLYPAGGGTNVGTRIPLAIALELTLTGDPIEAQRAYEIGLINYVVTPEKVLESAVELAGRIAANGPLGIAAIKELVRLAVSDPARVTERNRYWQPAVFTSEDAKEGAVAFMEKRQPVWKGK